MSSRARSAASAALVLLLSAFAVGVVHHKVFRWKRFDVVESGRLYRSGMLRDWQLRQAVEKYGVKTVFSFTFENNDREQRTCDELGVERHFCYLHGNGVGPDAPYIRFLEIASDPANHPVLVHCSAGVQRTGGAVALYRSVLQGRGFEQAVQEMIAKGNSGDPVQVEQLRRIHDRLVHGGGATCPRPDSVRSPL